MERGKDCSKSYKEGGGHKCFSEFAHVSMRLEDQKGCELTNLSENKILSTSTGCFLFQLVHLMPSKKRQGRSKVFPYASRTIKSFNMLGEKDGAGVEVSSLSTTNLIN